MPRLRRVNHLCSSTVSGTAYRFRHGSTPVSYTHLVAHHALAGDLIMMVANQCRPYEIVPGSTDKAIDICMDAVIKLSLIHI